MGCDIHLYVEKRNADGKWEPLPGEDPWIAKIQKIIADQKERGESDPYWENWLAEKLEHPQVLSDWLYDGRSYNLFAILADVRNGYGFAGIPTGDGFVPIADPRGLPEDVTDEVRAEYKEWDVDAHSASYHTLRQLEEYDWTQTTGVRKPVMVSEGNGASFPEYPFGEENPEYAPITYADAAGKFYTEALPKLRELAEGDPDSVRIVFWFDN